ncbi:MAG: geranylgeranylglycerol-phosphate geranylgeranyltransferase [Sulfolobales archaeon]|nr:geranylgeranylglycerol-phosphate geranylgeranyltransferase [Sulfolobales archaeon]MCX8208359.1 geranylgeranylglycerol-phosphate geranylgeranyltransferase [Sulfolobales archaeon]MDW8010095.1 geranylgeranylglycerol-phosphate geranylgeranyltransferase [Sulfolobales archaeon]
MAKRSKSGEWKSSRLGSKLSAYVELVRPHNVLAAILCVILGVLSASRAVEYSLSILDAVIACAVVALVSASGYAINDYFDYKVDAVNKPYRPIPSGRVSLGEVLYFSLVLGIVGVAISAWFNYISLIFVALNAVLVYSYSARIKERGLLGNLVVSFEGSASILYGSLVVYTRTGVLDALSSALVPASIAFTLLLGREIVKTIEDYYADSVRNVRSLPRVVGLRVSAVVASAVLLLVPALAVLPLYTKLYNTSVYLPLATVTVVIVVFSVVKLLRSPNLVLAAIKVRSILKIAMVTGILALTLSLLIT